MLVSDQATACIMAVALKHLSLHFPLLLNMAQLIICLMIKVLSVLEVISDIHPANILGIMNMITSIQVQLLEPEVVYIMLLQTNWTHTPVQDQDTTSYQENQTIKIQDVIQQNRVLCIGLGIQVPVIISPILLPAWQKQAMTQLT